MATKVLELKLIIVDSEHKLYSQFDNMFSEGIITCKCGTERKADLPERYLDPFSKIGYAIDKCPKCQQQLLIEFDFIKSTVLINEGVIFPKPEQSNQEILN